MAKPYHHAGRPSHPSVPGSDHTCALREDGTPVCWGANWAGQAEPPEGERFVTISGGSGHTCGLREDGTPVCWGGGEDEISPFPEGPFSSISNACALRKDGTPVCWGDDHYGQASPPDGVRLVSVSSGRNRSCGIREDGSFVCWGAGQDNVPPSRFGEKFTAIAVGADHTCALREDGTAYCWGSNSGLGNDQFTGQASPPRGEQFKVITAGDNHTCALKDDGTIVCWGVGYPEAQENDNHLTFEAASQESFTSISSGQGHVCALREGGIAACWGENVEGRASPPSLEFKAISSGTNHTCGLRASDGVAVCWGSNVEVQRYENDYKGQADPPYRESFVSISSGAEHTCALREDGSPVCWGDNDWRQSSPPKGERFTSLQSGAYHTCGLRHDGTILCWGDGHVLLRFPREGRFVSLTDPFCALREDGSAVCWVGDNHYQSPPEMEQFTDITAGSHHTCGLRDEGSAVCWGINVEPIRGRWYGQSSPPMNEGFTDISAGPHFTCGLRLDGTPLCWGEGYDTPEPERIEYEDVQRERFVSIGTGSGHSCGLRSDGSTVCWGDAEPERRWGDHGREWPPVGVSFRTISTGRDHTCGLRVEDNSPLCWGENLNGSAFPPRNESFAQISSGSGTTCGLRWDGSVECWGWLRGWSGPSVLPLPSADERFVTVESGSFHVCALRDDGSPKCWGDNESGESTPPEGERFASISAGAEHSCALRQDGTPVCWGDPTAPYDFGQASPPPGEAFVAISCGGYHTCALRRDGTPVCWGARLGDEVEGIGQVAFGQSEPPAGEKFVSISSGPVHSCALRANGTPVCWGAGFPRPESTAVMPPPTDAPSIALELPTLPLLPEGIVAPPVPRELSGAITVHGSNVLAHLTKWVGVEFQREHENVQVRVSVTQHPNYESDARYSTPLGGFILGHSHMAHAAGPITQAEREIAEDHGVKYVELPVAMSPIVIATNWQNQAVQCITMDQLRAFWKEDSVVSNWYDLNPSWPDLPIVPYRHSESAVVSAFARALFGHDASLRSTEHTYAPVDRIISPILQESSAIGYADYGSFLTKQWELKGLQVDDGSGCMSPTEEVGRSRSISAHDRAPVRLYQQSRSGAS